MSEVVILTQLARKLNLTFRLLVPPSIAGILVTKIGIFNPIRTLTIVFTLSSYSIWVVGYPSGLTIAAKAHSPFGWVEMKPWLIPKQIGSLTID